MIGNKDGSFNPAEIKVYGLKVAIRKNETDEEVEHNGIVVPNSTIAGYKGVTGTILSCGKEAMKQFGITIGDQVRFDHCGVYHDTTPVVVLNAENIIVKVDQNGNDIPLKNTVFAKKIGALGGDEQEGVLLIESATQAAFGEIFKVDNNKLFDVGDKILLTTGCDTINSKNGTYYIYPVDDIVCTIQD